MVLMTQTWTLSPTKSIRVCCGYSNPLRLLLRELRLCDPDHDALSPTSRVGKPVVLTGFGLVSQDNLPSFVPFNATSAPYSSSKGIISL